MRPQPMTVRWSKYAVSITDRPVKGMLTGPVTMLQWSFVRDDQPRSDTARQIAEALDRLSAAMQAAPDGGGQAALMEQVRENLGRSGVALEKAGQDLVTIAAKSREETKASLDGLAEALRQMPQGSADLAELLETRLARGLIEITDG